MTPINTGKVQIGRCYIPPAMPVQGDAVAIQSALLAKSDDPYDYADRVVMTGCAVAVVVIPVLAWFGLLS